MIITVTSNRIKVTPKGWHYVSKCQLSGVLHCKSHFSFHTLSPLGFPHLSLFISLDRFSIIKRDNYCIFLYACTWINDTSQPNVCKGQRAQINCNCMTANEFKALALSFPGTIEKPHFDRTAFKVINKRIFATLHEESKSANIVLPLKDQDVFCAINKAFYRYLINGAPMDGLLLNWKISLMN